MTDAPLTAAPDAPTDGRLADETVPVPETVPLPDDEPEVPAVDRLENGVIGSPYREQVLPDTLNRAMPPVQFSIAGGALPPGLLLGAGGLITGTPTEAGTFAVSIQGHDANNEVHTGDYSIEVLDAEPAPE